MARSQGRLGTLEISSNFECSWFDLGCLKDLTFSATQDEIEVTCRDDGPFRAYLSGRKDGEFSIEGEWDEANAGQGILCDAFFSAMPISIRYRPRGPVAGGRQFISRATITAFDINSELDGSNNFSATLRLSGDFTASFQPTA